MRTSRRRLLLGVLAATIVMFAGSACSTSATSAALVGSAAIAEQTIFDQTAQRSDQFEQAGQTLTVEQLALLNRLETTDAIRSALLAQLAADRGIEVTDAQVNAALRAGSTTSPPPAQVQAYRDQLRLEGLLNALGDQELTYRDVVATVDGVQVASRDLALAVRDALRAQPIDAPIPPLGANTRTLSEQQFDLSGQNAALNGVFNAQRGDVLINAAQDDGTYYVVRVIDVHPATEQGRMTASAILKVQDVATQRDLAAVALLQSYAEDIGVTVNPRIGVWDPVTMRVVASNRAV